MIRRLSPVLLVLLALCILVPQAYGLDTCGGPGTCIGGSYCDDSVCYLPESNVSKLFCQCQLLDPECGLGFCEGIHYCESSLCGDPVCYDANHFLSLALCSGIPLDNSCQLTSVEGCTAPPPDMVVWWNFDETAGPTAADTMGNNHGTHQNGPLPWPGQVANGLLFDGIDDGVLAPRVDPHSYHNLTLDAWIRLDVTGADLIHPIVHYGAHMGASVEYSFFVDGDELFFATQVQSMSFAIPSSGANLQPHVWHHVAVTADTAKGEVLFYVDGQVVSSYNQYVATGSHLIPGQAWKVGYLHNDLFFDGMIDEVEIFERPLRAWEIRALYNAGPAGKCKKE